MGAKSHWKTFIFTIISLTYVMAASGVSGGEKIRYSPPSVPSFSIPIIQGSTGSARMQKLLSELEKIQNSNPVADTGGAVSQGFLNPAMSKRLTDKLKKRRDLEKNWIIADADDYKNLEDEENWVGNDDQKLFDDESEDSASGRYSRKDDGYDYSGEGNHSSILTRYLAGNDSKSGTDKSESNRNGEVDPNSGEFNDDEEMDSPESQDIATSLVVFEAGDVTPQSDNNGLQGEDNSTSSSTAANSGWERLFDGPSSVLSKGLSSESSMGSGQSLSSILASGNPTESVIQGNFSNSSRASNILEGDINKALISHQGSTMNHIFGKSDPINDAADKSSQIAGPSSLSSMDSFGSSGGNPLVETSSGVIGTIGSNFGNGFNSVPSGIIGQGSGAGSMLQSVVTPEPTQFKQPTVLSFPKRRF